jgi:D-beta-D-heptose 7-phosphate kinase / D-beta-D-heptose 1-phosphate adenosyltransferase
MDEFQFRDSADDATPPPLSSHRAPGAAELAVAIRKLARSSVLVAGDAMLDRYIYGTVERVSREAPVPVLTVDREVAMPGGAGNVVRNLGALGVAAAFVSVVGDDQAGSDLTGLIGSQPGVEPWLLVQGSRATCRKTRYIAQGQQVLRSDREDTAPIHPKLAERMLRILRDAMLATTVTVLSDYGKGVLSGDIPSHIVNIARGAGRLVVADSRGDFARFAGADVLTPMLEELERHAGQRLHTDEDIAVVADALRLKHGFGAVLVNRAEDGMTLVDKTGVTHLRIETPEGGDISGVGDTAVATLAAGLAAGLELPVAARIASLASYVVQCRHGIAVAREGDLLGAVSPQGSALRKIVPLETAATKLENWRRDGWQTAVTLGRFDTLGAAQLEQLARARAESDRLVVGLERDRAGQNGNGHAGEPAGTPEAIRAAQLATLDSVDLVVLVDSSNPAEFLHALRPDLLLAEPNHPGAELLPTWGGRVAAI